MHPNKEQKFDTSLTGEFPNPIHTNYIVINLTSYLIIKRMKLRTSRAMKPIELSCSKQSINTLSGFYIVLMNREMKLCALLKW